MACEPGGDQAVESPRPVRFFRAPEGLDYRTDPGPGRYSRRCRRHRHTADRTVPGLPAFPDLAADHRAGGTDTMIDRRQFLVAAGRRPPVAAGCSGNGGERGR